MLYDIGDKVTIVVDDTIAYQVGLNDKMLSYNGEDAIITRVQDKIYFLDIDNGGWSWSEDMLDSGKVFDKGYKFIIANSPQKLFLALNRFIEEYPNYEIISNDEFHITADNYVVLQKTNENYDTISIKDNK